MTDHFPYKPESSSKWWQRRSCAIYVIRLLLRSVSSETSAISSYRQAIRAMNDINTKALPRLHAHIDVCYERESRLSHASTDLQKLPNTCHLNLLVSGVQIYIYIHRCIRYIYVYIYVYVLENVYFPDPMTPDVRRLNVSIPAASLRFQILLQDI